MHLDLEKPQAQMGLGVPLNCIHRLQLLFVQVARKRSKRILTESRMAMRDSSKPGNGGYSPHKCTASAPLLRPFLQQPFNTERTPHLTPGT